MKPLAVLTLVPRLRPSHLSPGCLRPALAFLALLALLGSNATQDRAAPALPPSARQPARFDWQLYESWTRARGRPGIPLTRFSWPWMAHRAMCGGAVTGEILNPRTLSYIQDFDRCWADWGPLSTVPSFTRYAVSAPGASDGGSVRDV